MALSYIEVQTIYRAEKKTPALCKVDDDFYSQVNELISQVDESHTESIKKMVHDISVKRRNKVLTQAMRTSDSEPMNAIPSEKKLYWKLVELLEKHQDLVYEGEPDMEEPEDKPEEKPEVKEQIKKKKTKKGDTLKLRIIKPIPAIVDSSAKNIGPFEESDEVELPLKTAMILIDWKVAEEI